MKKFITSFVIALIAGLASIAFETCSGSKAVQNHITNDGLTIIAALFAINTAALPSILSILRTIEESGPGIGAFKQTRESALSGLRETLILGVILYAILAISGEEMPSTLQKDETWKVIISWSAAAAARACIFLTAYNTYDFAKALINMSSVQIKAKS